MLEPLLHESARCRQRRIRSFRRKARPTLAPRVRRSIAGGRAPQFFGGVATTINRLGGEDIDLAWQCSKISAVKTPDEHSSCRLTTREIEVLKRIAEGNTTKEVAAILGITYKTAVCHRSHIMEKLGIHDTATLVRYAIREGIVRP